MEITWYGISCFRVTERGMATVVTDPYADGLGLGKLKLKADVVTVSHDAEGHSNLDAVSGKFRPLTSPGEYEIGEVFITGVAVGTLQNGKGGGKKKKKKEAEEPSRRNVLFVLDYDGIMVAHLGDLNGVPSRASVEELTAVDVALIPVGGGAALTPSQASEVISLIEPSIVIPMHYKTGKEKIELGSVDPFLSEMGISDYEPEESLKVTKSALTEETQVVVLRPPK